MKDYRALNYKSSLKTRSNIFIRFNVFMYQIQKVYHNERSRIHKNKEGSVCILINNSLVSSVFIEWISGV